MALAYTTLDGQLPVFVYNIFYIVKAREYE